MIAWMKPNTLQEAGEYFKNPKTKDWVYAQGREFLTKKEFTDKFNTGELTIYSEPVVELLNFEELKEGNSYNSQYIKEYINMLGVAQTDEFLFQAPIVIEGSEDYLFSGNRRCNMALFLNQELWVWKVKI